MKDVGEAVASVIILGIGLSITISAVASGRLFSVGNGACREGISGDCLLFAVLVIWGLSATIVGSAYVVFRNTTYADPTIVAESPQITRTANSKQDRKSTRLNSSHLVISYAVFV